MLHVPVGFIGAIQAGLNVHGVTASLNLSKICPMVVGMLPHKHPEIGVSMLIGPTNLTTVRSSSDAAIVALANCSVEW